MNDNIFQVTRWQCSLCDELHYHRTAAEKCWNRCEERRKVEVQAEEKRKQFEVLRNVVRLDRRATTPEAIVNLTIAHLKEHWGMMTLDDYPNRLGWEANTHDSR
jgi:hypothetical protein